MQYRLLPFLVFVFLLLCPAVYSLPIVHITPVEAKSFTKAFTSLSRQAHLTIVCENQPLHLALTPEASKSFDFARLESGVTAEEAVTQIANAYDYVAVPLSPRVPNCYLLTKRYTSHEDIPYLTLDEIANALQQILSATGYTNIDAEPDISLHSFWSSLSDEQRETAATGIKINQLLPAQKEYIRKFSVGLVFNAHRMLDSLAGRLKRIHKPGTRFILECTDPISKDFHVPGYEIPVGTKQFFTVILGGWFYTTTNGVPTGELPSLYRKPDSSKPENSETEPTHPRNPIPPPEPAVTRTLAQIAEWANGRLAQSDGDFKSAIVAPAVAEKPLFVVGEQYLSPVDVMKAAGDVYGLPVLFSRERGTVRIVLPVGHPVREAAEIKREVERLLPLPYRHAAATAILHNDDPDVDEEVFKQMAKYSPVVAFRPLKIVVVRRVREIIEPLMAKRKDKILPMAEAPAEARNLIALSAMLIASRYLAEVSDPIPAFITHFEDATVQMSKVGRQASASVTYTGADGQTSGTGISITFAEDQYYPRP